MRLRWLKFEPGNVVEYVTLPGLLFDRKIPQTNKWFRSSKLQFSTDNGETWQDVEDGPLIPFDDWKGTN